MGDIFQEIDEDLRRDRWEQVWKKYGQYLVAAAGAIVIATAGWVAWQEYSQRQDVALTAALHGAMSSARAGNSAEAIAAFAAAADEGNADQAALALFQEAALRAQNDDRDAALGIYLGLRGNEALDEPYRAMATIRAVELDLVDGDAATMLGWLAPLTDGASPWRHVAWELAALLEQQQGNLDAARDLFERLAGDDESTAAAKARAEAYLAQL